jgi:hypothetical protein
MISTIILSKSMCFFCKTGHVIKGTRGEENYISRIFERKISYKKGHYCCPISL